MVSDISRGAAGRLERSCEGAAGDWIRAGPEAPGVERAEACFAGHGYDPHRHDTYALGYTLAGVQAFRYRGAAERCTAGELFVLHPDELHDGRAGGDGGFRYRILYIDPGLVHAALAGPLPFVRDAVSRDARLGRAIARALDDLDAPLDELGRDALILEVSEALAAAAGGPRLRTPAAPDRRGVEAARALLDAATGRSVASAELERASGHSRFSLARHFRACLGTSPHRYLALRRLDRARRLIAGGLPLAEAAGAAGFADQSHLTRQFRRAYGLTPGRWARMCREAG